MKKPGSGARLGGFSGGAGSVDFEKRRGHPILINMAFREELLALRPPATLRDFMNVHTAQIEYVDADETVLQDLDTPEDYNRYQKS